MRPGITTGELDAAAARVFAAPRRPLRRRSSTTTSRARSASRVGDEAVHGIPGPRRLREGELVKLDVTAELDGFYADACRTVAVGKAKPRGQRIVAAAQAALKRGWRPRPPARPSNAIGAAVQAEVERAASAVCAELTGHGIGRRIHEEPTSPTWRAGPVAGADRGLW